MPPSRRLLVAVMCVLAAVAAAAAQQDEAARERDERVAEQLTLLGAKDGAKIADVGSADGFYTVRIAKAVAPTGRAFAVDINAAMLDKLRQRASRDNVSNVETILGDASDTRLPAGEMDAVLIRNAYHEMPEYRAILASVLRSLKPGGLLVVSEGIHDDNRGKSREQQVKEHEIAPDFVDSELREAGFEILDRQDPFMAFIRPPKGGFWLIRARKPR